MASQTYAQMQHTSRPQFGSGPHDQQPHVSYGHIDNPRFNAHTSTNTHGPGNLNGGENAEGDQMDSPEELDHDHEHDHDHDHGVWERSDTKRSKREPGGSSGKKIRSCIYCRRRSVWCHGLSQAGFERHESYYRWKQPTEVNMLFGWIWDSHMVCDTERPCRRWSVRLLHLILVHLEYPNPAPSSHTSSLPTST